MLFAEKSRNGLYLSFYGLRNVVPMFLVDTNDRQLIYSHISGAKHYIVGTLSIISAAYQCILKHNESVRHNRRLYLVLLSFLFHILLEPTRVSDQSNAHQDPNKLNIHQSSHHYKLHSVHEFDQR